MSEEEFTRYCTKCDSKLWNNDYCVKCADFRIGKEEYVLNPELTTCRKRRTESLFLANIDRNPSTRREDAD